MGCDIHAHIQYRHKDDCNRRWITLVENFNLWRNYEIFSSLAGVRCKKDVRTKFPKGLPNDTGIDYRMQRLMDDTDAHSKSWATLQEWRDAVEPYAKQEYTMEYQLVTRILEMLENSGCEVRVIYWFDN
jgi:hypothetical protein